MFIQLLLPGSACRKNRLQKHSGQMSTRRGTSSKETCIKGCSMGVNRWLALSQAAKNKHTVENTNKGISSVLTLVHPQRRIWFFFFRPVALQNEEVIRVPQRLEVKQLPTPAARMSEEWVCCMGRYSLLQLPAAKIKSRIRAEGNLPFILLYFFFFFFLPLQISC